MMLLQAHALVRFACLRLPEKMQSVPAFAMLLAIGLQESKFESRRQKPSGPARGYWQFEMGGGTRGVLTHGQTSAIARQLCFDLDYSTSEFEIHPALEHNDVLAACFARLLLYTVPEKLPSRDDVVPAWGQYLNSWRPGKPRPADWPENFVRGWQMADRKPVLID